MGDDSFKDPDSKYQGISSGRSFYNKVQISLPKHKLSGEGSEASRTARFLQSISTALYSQDRRLFKAWEGKKVMLTIDDFTQNVFNEAAEALMNKATSEGLPPGLFLTAVERDLGRIKVEATPRAVAAANALILKKIEGVALKVQNCFTGIALDAVTSLGLHRFGEWRMKLLTDSAGQDPRLVYKLTKMVTEGFIMEDTSSNNGLNYRKMTSKDDIGAVYRLHIPRMYNLVLAVVRAHNAQEALRRTEREGGAALKETSIAFNDDGEVLPPKTPAVAKVIMTHHAAAIGGDADRPRAQRALRLTSRSIVKPARQRA
jgi:hypothetical protein